MPKRPTKKSPPAQRKKKRFTKAELAAIAAQKAEIRRIKERAKKDILAAEVRLYRLERAQREGKIRDRQRAAKLFERAGLYDPKAYPTKSKRSRRERTLMQQFRDFINPDTSTFIPTKSKRARTKARARAAEIGLKVTPKGFFFPKEGKSKLSLKYDRQRKEYEVQSSRKEMTKRTGKTRTVTRVYPLEPLKTTKGKLEALREKGKRLLGKKPRATDRLVFTVEGPHRGRSRSTYENEELLVNDLEKRYDRSQNAPAHLKGGKRAHFLGFLELVSIKKTTRSAWVKAMHLDKNEAERVKERQKKDKRRKRGLARIAARR